jgi:hypothetical protein
MVESVIASFMVSKLPDIRPEMRDRFLRDGKVLWSKALCRNPAAFPFLKRYLKKWLPIHLKWVSSHCSDIEFLRLYESKLDYRELSGNPHASEILERRLDKVDWEILSSNPGAVGLLKKYPEMVDWGEASACLSDEMMEWILDRNADGVDWFELSFNPHAIKILKKFPEQIDEFAINFNIGAEEILKAHPEWIDYNLLSANQSEWAMCMVRERLDRASFENLSANEFAIDILLAHPDRIDWVMAKENERVGLLYRAHPQELDVTNTATYESMLPFIDPQSTSAIALALNPGIFCQDEKEYKERLKVIHGLVCKVKVSSK